MYWIISFISLKIRSILFYPFLHNLGFNPWRVFYLFYKRIRLRIIGVLFFFNWRTIDFHLIKNEIVFLGWDWLIAHIFTFFCWLWQIIQNIWSFWIFLLRTFLTIWIRTFLTARCYLFSSFNLTGTCILFLRNKVNDCIN